MFDATKFGDASVQGSGDIPALATLDEVLLLYKDDRIMSTLRVEEIGSEMVAMSPETYLLDALRMMFKERIRRIFLTGEEKKSVFPFVSSRDIIRFLFSPLRLDTAKERPEQWLDAKLIRESTKARPLLFLMLEWSIKLRGQFRIILTVAWCVQQPTKS